MPQLSSGFMSMCQTYQEAKEAVKVYLFTGACLKGHISTVWDDGIKLDDGGGAIFVNRPAIGSIVPESSW
jgi:sRNA-binding regulator protein Hfq